MMTKDAHTPNDLREHPMWSSSDYAYLTGKGYSKDEIRAFWDRDIARGGRPVHHKPAPQHPFQSVFDRFPHAFTIGDRVTVQTEGERWMGTVQNRAPDGRRLDAAGQASYQAIYLIYLDLGGVTYAFEDQMQKA